MTTITGLLLTLAVPLAGVIWGRYLRVNPPAFRSGAFFVLYEKSEKG